MFGGMKIVSDPYCTEREPSEDWSQVRSPGRAARRRKKYPQRIRIYFKPAAYRIGDTLFAHPAIIAELRKPPAHDR
jgi:hypothetical protein